MLHRLDGPSLSVWGLVLGDKPFHHSAVEFRWHHWGWRLTVSIIADWAKIKVLQPIKPRTHSQTRSHHWSFLLSVALTFPSQTVLLLSGCQIPQLWSIDRSCSIIRWWLQSAIHSSSVDKAGMTAPRPHGNEENVSPYFEQRACQIVEEHVNSSLPATLSGVKRWHRRQDWIFSFSYLYYFNHKNVK